MLKHTKQLHYLSANKEPNHLLPVNNRVLQYYFWLANQKVFKTIYSKTRICVTTSQQTEVVLTFVCEERHGTICWQTK
jgi:hypothetical protein